MYWFYPHIFYNNAGYTNVIINLLVIIYKCLHFLKKCKYETVKKQLCAQYEKYKNKIYLMNLAFLTIVASALSFNTIL